MRPKKTNRRRKPAKKPAIRLRLPRIRWNILVNLCALLGISALLYTGVLWVLQQPINSVRVEGTFERVSAVQVEAAMASYLDQGFLSLNLADVQEAVASLPWVERAGIRRSWPAALTVTLVEERAAARWGEHGLLNVYGELFVERATHIPQELPRLSGPEGTQLEVAQQFFALDTQLHQRGLSAVALSLDARGAWEVRLSNGVRVRLGAVDIDVRTERFFVALDSVLEPMVDRIDYVDMRYTNGFAIGWKEGLNADLMQAVPELPNV